MPPKPQQGDPGNSTIVELKSENIQQMLKCQDYSDKKFSDTF